jgi:hypothetical protein
MGEEAFDEVVIVANSGSVFIRGGYGREELVLGLARGRNEVDPDVAVTLTPLQQERLREALCDMRPTMPGKRPNRLLERFVTTKDGVPFTCGECGDPVVAIEQVGGREPIAVCPRCTWERAERAEKATGRSVKKVAKGGLRP